MKTVEELKIFYDDVLRNKLIGLDFARKEVQKYSFSKHEKFINIFAILYFPIGILIICLFREHIASILVGMVVLLLIFLSFYFMEKIEDEIDKKRKVNLGVLVRYDINLRTMFDDYKKAYKNIIINDVVKFMDMDLKYIPEKFSFYKKFLFYKESNLFDKNINNFTSEDYFCGHIKDTKIEFCEVNNSYLSFKIDFNKNFEGETYVLHKINNNEIIRRIDSKHLALINLEDPEFESKFITYGSNQIEARYILSTSLMERILEYSNKINREMNFAFVEGKVFININFHENLFEPSIDKSIVSFEQIKEYYDIISISLIVVDELSLNTRIWTK